VVMSGMVKMVSGGVFALSGAGNGIWSVSFFGCVGLMVRTLTEGCWDNNPILWLFVLGIQVLKNCLVGYSCQLTNRSSGAHTPLIIVIS
jgi:hypothetical protein